MAQRENWIEWSRELLAISQNGLTFTKDPFDAERYERIKAIAQNIVCQHSNIDAAQMALLFSGEQGYATPKVDVRGGVFVGDKVLLVRERSDGLWTLPGGWADVGASPSEAVIREIREESGFQAKIIKVAAVYDRNRHPHPPMLYHVYKIFFMCEVVGGEARGSIETDEVRFFAEDNLPALSIPRVTEGQIKRLFEHNRDKLLPTEFD